MKAMGDEEFILTIGTAMIPMIIGLAYIVAPDFTRYFLGKNEDPKRAPDKVLRRLQIFGVVLIGVGVLIIIYNFTHPENIFFMHGRHFR